MLRIKCAILANASLTPSSDTQHLIQRKGQSQGSSEPIDQITADESGLCRNIFQLPRTRFQVPSLQIDFCRGCTVYIC